MLVIMSGIKQKYVAFVLTISLSSSEGHSGCFFAGRCSLGGKVLDADRLDPTRAVPGVGLEDFPNVGFDGLMIGSFVKPVKHVGVRFPCFSGGYSWGFEDILFPRQQRRRSSKGTINFTYLYCPLKGV